ncbi:hypothetical protein FKM82_002200 [Ascaphus truei]
MYSRTVLGRTLCCPGRAAYTAQIVNLDPINHSRRWRCSSIFNAIRDHPTVFLAHFPSQSFARFGIPAITLLPVDPAYPSCNWVRITLFIAPLTSLEMETAA